MSIDIERVTDADVDTWNRSVERSPQTNLFHRYEALQVQAAHADATLHPLIGYKGQEVVGLFPLFEVRKGPFTTLFSPPPGLRISYLGPALLNMNGIKQRKGERRLQSFIDGCLEWAESEVGPRYGFVRVHGAYEDVRPFIWRECDIDPSYTYHVHLDEDEEAIMMRFSSDARNNIRNGRDADYEIEQRGQSGIREIIEQVAERYESQGITFGVPSEFVVDLHDRLPEGSVRPYSMYVDDEFVGGILALEDDGAIYRWQGGVRTDADLDVAVNDLLDWHLICEGRSRGRDVYDLVGASNQRINRYKSKFNPELVPYYSIEWGTPVASFLASVYQRIRQRS